MIMQVFAVKDRALEAHMRPWFAFTTGQAIRMFSDEVNNPTSDMHKHPDDYDLWHLGSWNDENANFTNVKNEQIAMGKQVKNA